MPIQPTFSAVELLIVAGIASILVSIAVPGYMEAKARAEVTEADYMIRQVHSSLIQYRIDHNHFPDPPSYAQKHPFKKLRDMEYLNFTPLDRFKKDMRQYGHYYSDPLFGYDKLTPTNPVYTQTLLRLNSWNIASSVNPFEINDGVRYIKSIGPDRTDFRDEGFERTSGQPNIMGLVPYDATNGIFSLGEIVLFVSSN